MTEPIVFTLILLLVAAIIVFGFSAGPSTERVDPETSSSMTGPGNF